MDLSSFRLLEIAATILVAPFIMPLNKAIHYMLWELQMFDDLPGEERILFCNQPRSAGVSPPDEEGKYHQLWEPCGNLMKIHVYSDAEGREVHVATPQIPDGADGFRNGACITHNYQKHIRGYRGKVVYGYGPKRIVYFTFVHCKRCYKRHAWTKFRKADI